MCCLQSAGMKVAVAVAVVLILALAELGSSLLIGAFNIKSFGDKKASNATLMDIISTVSHKEKSVVFRTFANI